MNVRLLYAALAARDVPRSRTPIFEMAVFAVLEGEPDKVVFVDDEGDEITAEQLLGAYEMNAADYADGAER